MITSWTRTAVYYSKTVLVQPVFHRLLEALHIMQLHMHMQVFIL